ncbi:MAG: hypothetical protein J5J06_04280 [Phycisphaerae bacterium]|nr:hypothetical protein [Phycisphaerae bacterium]
MAQPQGVNTRLIVVVGIVSTLLLIISVAGIQAAYFNAAAAEEKRKFENDVYWELADARLDQQEKLNKYRWVDQSKQIAAIPIDRAIELTAKRYHSR